MFGSRCGGNNRDLLPPLSAVRQPLGPLPPFLSQCLVGKAHQQPLLDAIAIVLESRTQSLLGNQPLEVGNAVCVVYCAVASAVGESSLDSYHLLCGSSIMKNGFPPARWLSDYARIVNKQAAEAWCSTLLRVILGDNIHASVLANGEARGDNYIDNTRQHKDVGL